MLVVIAIIAILAGITSMAVSGFVRDARLETANSKARMIYTAFQDIIMDCEIKQDNSIFEGHDGDSTEDIIGAVVFFRISQTDAGGHTNKNGLTGLGDEIHVMCMHVDGSHIYNGGVAGQAGLCSRSFWIEGTSNSGSTSGSGANNSDASSIFGEKGAKRWEKFNSYISGRMDNSMDGTYVVAVDLVNYQVISVVCRDLVDGRDPKTGLYDPSEVISGAPVLGSYINGYDSATYADGSGSVSFPVRSYIVKDLNQEKNIYKKTGVYVGCYPFGDTLYSNITAP